MHPAVAMPLSVATVTMMVVLLGEPITGLGSWRRPHLHRQKRLG
jgi:hypothetical protein